VALADATVRVILDVSRFDRDLDAKVSAAARRAGRNFEREFTRSATPAGQRYAQEFERSARPGMATAGSRAGTQFSTGVRRGVAPAGRIIGRDLGGQIRSSLVPTANQTGASYARQLLSSQITTVGAHIGQRLGRAIGSGIGSGGGGSGAGTRLQRSLQRDAEPGVLRAAATIAQRFGSALNAGMAALAPGRMGLFAAAIAGLVSEGAQLAAALAPGLQVIGLVPAAAAVAGAAIGTLVVAFKGVKDAVGAALSGDTEKLNEALKGLAPSAQKVVKEFGQFGPQLKAIKEQTQQAFFAPLAGDVTKLGKALLGPVRIGMADTAGAAGGLAHALAEVVSRAQNAGVIQQVFSTAAGAFQRMTGPLATVTQGMFSWIGATLPAIDQLVASLGRGAERFGQFLSRSASSGAAFAWVNEAISTFSQLWSIAKNVTGVLGAIFSAANSASGGYLININQALIATKQFLSSGEGHTALVQTFQGLHQVLAALGPPLREAVLQLGAVSQVAGSVATALSGGLTNVIRGIGQAIAAAGPGLTHFAESLGGALTAVGEALPGIGASIGRLLTAIAPLAQVLGGATQIVGLLLGVLSRLPSGLLLVVSAFLGLRALGVPTLFQSIGDKARDLPGTLTRVGSAFSSLSTTYQSNLSNLTALRTQQQTTNLVMNGGVGPAMSLGNALGSMGDKARAAGSVAGGALKSIGSGLLSLAGGPIGLAVAGVAALISIWSAKNDEAARKVQEHNQRVASLTATLDKSTGSITSATREMARNQFNQGELADAAKNLGISIDLVADAATRSAPAQAALNSILQDSSVNVLRTSDHFAIGRQEAERYGLSLDTIASAARGNKTAQDEVSNAVNRYANNLDIAQRSEFDAAGSTEILMGLARDMIPDQIKLGDAASKTADDLLKQADAVRKANDAFTPAQRLATQLADAMTILASNTSSAEDKARALDSALRILAGGTLSMEDAQKQAVDALTGGNQKLDELSKKYDVAGKSAKTLGISNQELKARQDELGKSLFDSAGHVNFYSDRAKTLYDVSKNLRQATLDQIAAIVDAGQKTGDLAGAQQKATGVMANARQTVIDWAKELGFSDKEAQRLADTMNLFPDDVKIALTMEGVPAILQGLSSVKGRIEVLPDNKSLRLDSNAAPLKGQLQALGFTIQEIPGTKDFTIVPNTQEAGAALETFIQQSVLQRRPDMIIGGNTDVAKASADDLKKYIESLPAKIMPTLDGAVVKGQAGKLLDELIPKGEPKITPGLNPGPAQSGLTGLLGGLTPPTGTPQITPGINPGPALGGMGGLLGGMAPPAGTPQITPGLNPNNALGTLNGFVLPSIYNSHADVGVGIAPGAAQQGLSGLVLQINASHGNVGVGANTGPASGSVDGLVAVINKRGASISVGADTSSASSSVNNLVQQVANRRVNISVGANTSIQAAAGGIFAYRSGGIHDPDKLPKMSARRAAIVPPNAKRVIGDRGWGRELFLPLVHNTRNYGLLRQAANELNFDLVPRTSGSSSSSLSGKTVNVQAGAVVVNAPYSNPTLVAKSVVNELVKEAVV
jgi:hypothetical protein